MSTRQIHVFISHSWAYSEHYDTLSEWIFKPYRIGQASLDFRNFSVPKDDPIHDAETVGELKNAIYEQIKRSHVVIIPTGMYTTYSKWIQKEIDGAKKYFKPILAVNPWGQIRAADIVVSNADKRVGWNSQSVIEGIWELYK